MNQPLILKTEPGEVFCVIIKPRKHGIKVKGSFANKRASYGFSALLFDNEADCGISRGRIVKLKVFRVYPKKGMLEIARFKGYWYTISKSTDEANSKANRRNLKLLVKRLEDFPKSKTQSSVSTNVL